MGAVCALAGNAMAPVRAIRATRAKRRAAQCRNWTMTCMVSPLGYEAPRNPGAGLRERVWVKMVMKPPQAFLGAGFGDLTGLRKLARFRDDPVKNRKSPYAPSQAHHSQSHRDGLNDGALARRSRKRWIFPVTVLGSSFKK